MTREQFTKYRYRAYMAITYNYPTQGMEPIECMLVGVDFDKEIFTLRPFPNGTHEPEDFAAYALHCTLGIPKLKLA